MQLIEAALAFAITMLALSLVVSSFVEMIHRVCSMREAGLKYMLGQMFDQVLDKYIRPGIAARVPADAADREGKISELVESARKGFVERMSANRAPMGAVPRSTPTTQAEDTGGESSLLGRLKSLWADPRNSLVHFWKNSVRLWNGRDLAAMTSAEFMERLGSMDVGQAIASANAAATNAARDAGATAADAVDVVLKDVAQKFEALGKEASVYFEGRARLLSVVVAMALAFLAHVDAVDLFRTYLRDPNARAKVIEQSQAVTAQHKAAADAARALTEVDPKATLTPEEVKKQIESLKNDWKEAIANANATVKQYADLGVPLGWDDERIKRAKMSYWVWTCKDPNPKDPKKKEGEGFESLWKNCGKNHWQEVGWFFKLPTAPRVWFYLFLGGLLVGLGAPFWYNAVVGLTNIRNTARGATSGDAQTRVAFVAAGAGTTQPVTPVDAFRVSNAAQR
jgi:hypothetical protein